MEIRPDRPIHIATMLATSGAAAWLGEDARGGIEIALADRGNSLLDHPFQLTHTDAGCSREGGAAAGTHIIAETNVVAVIGPTCSESALTALSLISDAGLVMISPSATNPTLTNRDTSAGGMWQPGFFRTAPNSLFQGQLAAEFAYDVLSARRAAIVHDGSAYAESLQQSFARSFAERDGSITFRGAILTGQTDMTEILRDAAATEPDVLYFPLFEPEGNTLVNSAIGIAELANTALVGADSLLIESFPQGAGSAAVDVYLTGPHVQGQAYIAFLERWTARFGTPPSSVFQAAYAYDATNLLLQAIEGTAQVGSDGSMLIGRQALRQAMANTRDFAGLTGRLTCDEAGDCVGGPGASSLAVYQVTETEVAGENWPPPVIWTP